MDGDDSFPDGSIIKIEFRDFLTYEQASLEAGRNLNLIIGVNGSGKSTIICAICLAVGGSPKNLGRSETIDDFVRHGKEQATVELFIADKLKGTQRFKLIIHRTGQACEYYVNNIKTNQKHVKELATGYNIQVDNPCTFLAQDKVKGFSEQNPVKLLSNTIKAGDPKLVTTQEELIKTRNENKALVNKKAETEERLVTLKGEIETLEPRVQNYFAQRQQDSKINALIQKQKVMEFDASNENYQRRLLQYKKVEKKRDKRKIEANELDAKQKGFLDIYNNLANDCSEMRRKYNRLMAELKNQARGDLYASMLGLQRKEYEEARKRYDEYEQILQQSREKRRDIEKTLGKVRRDIGECQHDSMFLTSERTRLNQERMNFEDQLNAEKGTLDRIRYEMRKLQQSFNNKSPYEDKLRILNGDGLGPECSYAAQVWSFLENNDTGITVNVPFFDLVMRRDYAKYIEQLVPPRDMLIFIFQSQEDELRVSQRFPKINTTVINPNQVRSSEIYARLPSRLKELGFDCYAIEMIQGPEIVLHYLCQVCGLNRIPIGSRPLQRYDETSRLLVDSFDIIRFINGNQVTNLKVSRYSGEMISNNRPILPPRFYLSHEKPVEASSGTEAQKKKLAEKENEIARRCQEIDRRRQESVARKAEVESKLCELKQLKEKENVLNVQLEAVKKKLYNEENNKPDLERAKAAYEEQKKIVAVRTLETAKEIAKQLENLNKYAADINVHNALINDTSQKMNELNGLYAQKQSEIKDFENELRNESFGLDTLKNKVKTLSEELQHCCSIPTTDESKLDPAHKVNWDKIKARFEQHDLNGKDKDEIDHALAQEQAQKKMRARDGKIEDVEKHRQLKAEQEDLEKTAAEQAASLQRSTEVLQKKIEEWQVPVENLIAAINKNYSKFFQELGCVGEICLDKPVDELDIANYGIHINVSFRANEPTKRLDHQVQSGGERSVATMLYLLALQELCPVPFRCVDEINQGMDPTNERKVFDIMINKLTGCGNLAKTQYFLLTPKLLHGLTYNDKVTVQCVHNSRALYPEAHTWDPQDFLVKARSFVKVESSP